MFAFLILLGLAFISNEIESKYGNRVSKIICPSTYNNHFRDEICYPRPSIAVVGVSKFLQKSHG